MTTATSDSTSITSSRHSWSSFLFENIESCSNQNSEDRDDFHTELTEKYIYFPKQKEIDGLKNKPPKTIVPNFNNRQMTYEQEILNALTMIPSPLYCIYKVFSGRWISEQARSFAESECGNPFHHAGNYNVSMISLLPPPMLAILFAVFIHFPVSFYYHWLCATHIPKGYERITHITRRLDHAFIHISLTLCTYAASGDVYYFLFCALFNADCVCRHFEQEVKPRRNQIRIGGSLILLILPIIWFGNGSPSTKLGIIFGLTAWIIIGSWFFVAYPIGGYSHAAFHLTLHLPLAYYLFIASSHLDSSIQQMEEAACILMEAGKL